MMLQYVHTPAVWSITWARLEAAEVPCPIVCLLIQMLTSRDYLVRSGSVMVTGLLSNDRGYIKTGTPSVVNEVPAK